MKIASILACGALCLASLSCSEKKPLVLHYNRPATYFEEALPLGNGKTFHRILYNACGSKMLEHLTSPCGRESRTAERNIRTMLS